MPDASQFPRFSAEEIAARHAKVQALMEEGNLKALLIYGSGRFASEVYWLTDWPGSREAYVLFQPAAPPVVLAQLYNHVPMARVMSVVGDVRWGGANSADAVVDLLKERYLEAARVGIVGGIPHTQYLRIREGCPGLDLVE